MKYSTGDKIMALWPGSGLYYHAEIKTVTGDYADIVYSDGTEMEIHIKHIKSEDYFKRKRSTSKSPGRRRSRSPARSPARKSRALKKPDSTPKRPKSRSASRGRPKSTVTPGQTKSRSISQSRVTVTSSSSSADEKPTIKKVTTKEVTLDSRYMVTRQRARTTSFKEEEGSRSQTKQPVQYEFGGVIGAFIMYLVLPVGILFLLLTSLKAKWSVSKFTWAMIPCTWEKYLSVKAFAIVLGFMLFHAIIYALPFGHIIKGPAKVGGKRLEYRIGARYTLFFTAVTYAAMFYFKVPILQVDGEIFHLAVAGLIISYGLNILLYIQSFWAPKEELNPNGDTGSFIYDSFIGRWMHPRIGKLFDLKLYLYRPCMAGWLVMVWIAMFREYETTGGKHNPVFLMVAVSQIFYILMEFFFDEEQCPFMFDIKNEALGLIQFVGELVMVPFLYSIQVRYLIDNPAELQVPNTLVFLMLTLTGYYFHIVSARQKNMFRKNPYDHRVAHYSSLPSSSPDGHRILISGLWGVVRQPHYLGDIMIGFSWSVLCGYKHLLPWFYPFMLTGLLFHRSQRVEARNLKKHGSAWKLYREKVPFRIVPGIY